MLQRARSVPGVRVAAELQRRILLRTFGLAALGLALGMAASRALSNTLGVCRSVLPLGALLILVAA